MLTDGIVLAIVIISAIVHAKRGFAMSVISSLQWLLCIVCGLFLLGPVKAFILDSPFGIGIREDIEEKISSSVSGAYEDSALPSLFKESADTAADAAAESLSETLTGVIVSTISFVAIILAAKLVLFIIFHIFSKEYSSGPLAWMDTVSGLILGLVLGALYVLIFLAVLAGVIGWLPDSWAHALTDSFRSSYFSGYIYDNNPILLLIQAFLG